MEDCEAWSVLADTLTQRIDGFFVESEISHAKFHTSTSVWEFRFTEEGVMNVSYSEGSVSPKVVFTVHVLNSDRVTFCKFLANLPTRMVTYT